MELLNQLIISVDLEYMEIKILDTEFRPLISKISIKLFGLKNRVWKEGFDGLKKRFESMN